MHKPDQVYECTCTCSVVSAIVSCIKPVIFVYCIVTIMSLLGVQPFHSDSCKLVLSSVAVPPTLREVTLLRNESRQVLLGV